MIAAVPATLTRLFDAPLRACVCVICCFFTRGRWHVQKKLSSSVSAEPALAKDDGTFTTVVEAVAAEAKPND
jgi:hypothetical protein